MKYRPHKYQQYAKDFILDHPVCCLMLDMGLGKTVITLSALWELALDRFDIGKILVIAPKRGGHGHLAEGITEMGTPDRIDRLTGCREPETTGRCSCPSVFFIHYQPGKCQLAGAEPSLGF